MSTMVTGRELRTAVESATFLQGGVVDCAEGVKYDFRLSPRILKAKFTRPVDANQLSEIEKRDLIVDPGEVVFVLTEERLKLPMNMVAQLSPKRKLSHAGILTLGGFCIDPGYEGRLLFGLFNFSSTPFPLIPGKKLVAATFFRLEGQELGDFPQPLEPLDDFPDELVTVMQKYSPVAAQSVVESVSKLQRDLAALREEIRSHETWYSRFKDSLEAHNKQIGDLTRDLAVESEARKSGQDTLTTAVSSIERTLSFLKGAAWVIMGLLGVGMTLFLGWIAKLAFGG